ncbi:hypothetical protein VNO77_18790 [Canavalia gladiata]|uniref:Fungal lipase-type domain-containing protein n=1 Tax=Canavalia gladiata TaxID=3824 RepID=A0AAN9LQ60_CANGL
MGTVIDKYKDEDDSNLSWRYLILSPQNGGVWELMRYALLGDSHSFCRFVDTNYDNVPSLVSPVPHHRWIIFLSILLRKIIAFFAKPMDWIGCFLDFLLNLLSQNANFFGLLYNLLHEKTYVSFDLQMHFVDFYNCWNDFQKETSTQVFILCDKAKYANLVLVSFRGTEPFNADDWSTDFDYSWYEIPKVGKVHMGFLEALGLGNRLEPSTFYFNLQGKNRRKSRSTDDVSNGAYSSKHNSEPLFPCIESDADQSFISETPPKKTKVTAYWTVRSKLKNLLEENKDAKFMVTGHSLGGALAILFLTVLVIHEEEEIMERLLGVYTFGQPRIGDRKLGRFMEGHLQHPLPKYFRVVYCNDLVPRLPYDDKTFLYKHFGVCLYYNSFYIEKEVEEEPNKNFFGIRFILSKHLNAVWELIRGLTIGWVEGADYKEGWFRMLFRVIGLVLPGISAHCPTDYVNSIRLGKESSI